MTAAPPSLLALVAQAPIGPQMTTTEGIVVVCIMLGLVIVAAWVRFRK